MVCLQYNVGPSKCTALLCSVAAATAPRRVATRRHAGSGVATGPALVPRLDPRAETISERKNWPPGKIERTERAEPDPKPCSLPLTWIRNQTKGQRFGRSVRCSSRALLAARHTLTHPKMWSPGGVGSPLVLNNRLCFQMFKMRISRDLNM